MDHCKISPAPDGIAGTPCRLYARRGPGRCGKPITVVVDIFDDCAPPPGSVRRLAACAEHVPNYCY